MRDWKKGEVDLIPGKTAPAITVVERDYPNPTSASPRWAPLMEKVGNGGRALLGHQDRSRSAGRLNGRVREEGVTRACAAHRVGHRRHRSGAACSPETNGHVAVKAWEALGPKPRAVTTCTWLHREDERSATATSGAAAQDHQLADLVGSERKVSYNAGYTNVHELIPWRTLTGPPAVLPGSPLDAPSAKALQLPSTGRPEDHCTKSKARAQRQQGNRAELHHPAPEVGIHSTYSDNLHMLTLNRGGPVIWLSEDDAKSAGIVDNDWAELFNTNGAMRPAPW